MTPIPEVTEMELAAIVAILCSPSSLNLAWARENHTPEKAKIETAFEENGFTPRMKEHARWLIEQIDREGARTLFGTVSQQLSKSWGRVEPHPTPTVAKSIVATLINAPAPR